MAEPLHILIVIDNFHPLVGGAEQAALGTARGLVARGHRLDVLTMRKEPDWPAEEELHGIRVLRFDEAVPPRPFGRLLYEPANTRAARRYIDRHLSAEAYDALLLHPIDAAFGAARSGGAAQAALVYCFHAPLGQELWAHVRGVVRREGRLSARLAAYATATYQACYRSSRQRATIRRSHAVACPSRYSRDLLEEAVPRLGHKHVEVIPWGVDAERFRPPADRAEPRAALGWPANETVLFTARRLVPRMGLGELVRAVGLASQQRDDLRLVIAGEGPLRGCLESLAQRAGGTVEFLGLVSEDTLVRCFQAADLFVLPSVDLEAFGLVTVEALACGTPVLGTQRCATPEILGPLDERLLMARDDARAIADAILGPGMAVAREPGFADRCRAYVLEHYIWERTAGSFERLIRKLVPERRVP
ncbi:MAG: glycosyltransferase family 4 protein [bacterium]